MSLNTIQNQNSKEWVGAPAERSLRERRKGCVEETVTPSYRVLRPRSRTKVVEEQAMDVKSTTGNTIGSVKKSTRNEAKPARTQNSWTPIGFKTSHKMSSSTQQEQPHRVDLNANSNQLPLSLDGGLSDDLSVATFSHLIHPTRVSNSTEIDRKMEIRINFPPSNDKIWCKTNEDSE
jgi:hypothetical protein